MFNKKFSKLSLTLLISMSVMVSGCNLGTANNSTQINTTQRVATIDNEYHGKLFLMGGAIADDNSQIYNALASATGKTPQPNKCNQDWEQTTCPKIAIITSAAASEADGDNAYYNDISDTALSYEHLYQKYGFAVKHITAHIDNYKIATNPNDSDGKMNLQIIENADVVFFNGGNQSRHARTWLNDDGSYNKLMDAIYKRFKADKLIVAGSSAGTAIQSNPTYGEGASFGHLFYAKSAGLAPKNVNDGAIGGTGLKDTRVKTNSLQYLDNGGKMPGFGLTPDNVLVDTHFDARGRLARLIPALYSTNKNLGVGVDENTAFFIQDNTATVYGQRGVFIADKTLAKKTDNKYFGVSGVRISYLSSGDKYDFTDNAVISNKQKITSPTYSSYKDSSDITKSYETTNLLTRLVDQTGGYNKGKTKAPSDYPSSTVSFSIIFDKDTQTTGYYGNNQYTVSKAIVDISE